MAVDQTGVTVEILVSEDFFLYLLCTVVWGMAWRRDTYTHTKRERDGDKENKFSICQFPVQTATMAMTKSCLCLDQMKLHLDCAHEWPCLRT